MCNFAAVKFNIKIITHSRKMKKILISLLVCLPVVAMAQVKGSWGVSGGMYFNKNDVLSFGVDVDYNWRLNSYLMLSAGAGILYNAIIDPVEQTVDGYIHYKNEKSTLNVVGNVAATLTVPVWSTTGVYTRGTFQFDLFPFQSIGLDKSGMGDDSVDTNPSNFVFTAFSPGVFGEVGVYHDFTSRRLFVGLGCGVYDLFHSYRHHTVDGLPMRSFAPQGDTYIRASVRLMGL